MSHSVNSINIKFGGVVMKKGNKISILGAGNVGATIAYTLTLDGMASEIVLVDINQNKAKGEAMDIIQGTALGKPVNIYAGDYSDIQDSDIVIVTLGCARKPGQSRIDLAQGNVNIIKSVMPQAVHYAPDAIYVVVSNPVDIITYTILKTARCLTPAVCAKALPVRWKSARRTFMLICSASTVIPQWCRGPLPASAACR